MRQDVRDHGGTVDGATTRERLLAGTPVRDRRQDRAGVPTAMLEGGDGPPMILLHGAGEFAGTWIRVIPDLMRAHRVIAPDLPGHGASGVTGALDVDHVLSWLGELIEKGVSEPPTVVGRGLGGALAARLAAQWPTQLTRLVLVGALGLSEFAPAPSFASALHEFSERPTEHTRDRLFAQCFADLDRVRRRMGERWPPLADYALERSGTPGMRTALAVLMPAFGLPAIPPADLARITVPTTLIWGRHDLQVPLPVAEAARTRHGWPLHVIDNAGDDPPMEQPEAFLAALRATATGGQT